MTLETAFLLQSHILKLPLASQWSLVVYVRFTILLMKRTPILNHMGSH